MSKENKELVKKMNEAFSKGNTEFIVQNITEDIRWNIVGMPVIKGKTDFLKAMKIMELESLPDTEIKNIIAEGNYVVVESSAGLNSKSGRPYRPSYCDVYKIKNGKVEELTTYVVDITKHED